MAEFVIPVEFHINTRGGQLDIPAGATVYTDGSGNFAGWAVPSSVTDGSPTDESPPPAPPAAAAPEVSRPSDSPSLPAEQSSEAPAAEAADGQTPIPAPATDPAPAEDSLVEGTADSGAPE